MTGSQDLLFEVSGQSIVFDAPEGLPSSATFKVWRNDASDESTVEFEGSATASSVNTTVSGAAGYSQANRKSLNLYSGTSVAAGSTYLLTNAGGQTEWVEVASVDGNAATSTFPLMLDYADGATFQGVRLSASVPASFYNDEDKLTDGSPSYRVLWLYTAASVARRHYSYFDLVRVPGSHDVKLNDLEIYFPHLRSSLGTDYRKSAEKFLTRAYENFKLDAKALGKDDSGILDRFVVNECIIRRALFDLAMSGYHPPNLSYDEWLATWRDEYNRVLDAHLRLTDITAQATDTDNAAGHFQGFWFVR